MIINHNPLDAHANVLVQHQWDARNIQMQRDGSFSTTDPSSYQLSAYQSQWESLTRGSRHVFLIHRPYGVNAKVVRT